MTVNQFTYAGRVGVRFTEAELRRLRELVKCMRCGAVPRDTGEKHEETGLPIVVTEHVPGCFAIGGRRPAPVKKRETGWSAHAQKPAGPCTVCGQEMTSSAGRMKLYCSEGCRSKAKRIRAGTSAPATPCSGVVHCGVCKAPTSTSRRWKKLYCSKRCRSQAARNKRKGEGS